MNNVVATIDWSKKVGNFLSNLLLGETKELIIKSAVKIEEIEKDIREMKSEIAKDIGEIKIDFKSLLIKSEGHALDIQGLKVHTKYGLSNSPTVPNDLGLKLLETSGFNAQYPKIKNKLFALMDTMNLRTLYDYEKGSVEALEKMKNDPDLDLVKDYVVNNPDHSLDLIFILASWVIRDDYAEYKARLTALPK